MWLFLVTYLRAVESYLSYSIIYCYLPSNTGECIPAIPVRQAFTCTKRMDGWVEFCELFAFLRYIISFGFVLHIWSLTRFMKCKLLLNDSVVMLWCDGRWTGVALLHWWHSAACWLSSVFAWRCRTWCPVLSTGQLYSSIPGYIPGLLNTTTG